MKDNKKAVAQVNAMAKKMGGENKASVSTSRKGMTAPTKQTMKGWAKSSGYTGK